MKHNIRKQYLEKRQSLTLKEKRKLDYELNQSLEEVFDWLNFTGSKRVLAFYPHEDKNEADIIPFLEELLIKRFELYFCRVKGDTLEAVKISSFEELESGNFGVKEPRLEIDATHHQSFDCILVPGVVFSEDCHRLGYGKGFYDKLLKDVDGLKIGVGFDFQVIKELPIEEHDVALDLVVTESGTYRAY